MTEDLHEVGINNIEYLRHSERSEESHNRTQGHKIPLNPTAWLLAFNESTGKAHRLDLSSSARNPLYEKGAYILTDQSFSSKVRVSSRLELDENKKLDSRTQEFENDMISYLSRKAGEFKSAFTLAEGATHVDTVHDIHQPAFTLAEVLITLGIIGIVAAMTLPMLAKNYQFYIRQQQFKKAYAALSVAVQKTQIDMGEGVRCHYDYTQISDNSTRADCESFYSELANNLHIIKACDGKALVEGCIAENFRGGGEVYAEVQGGDNPEEAKDYYTRKCGGFNTSTIRSSSYVFITNSGFSIIIYRNSLRGPLYPYVLLDINGLQGPNKWGHDIFVLRFKKKKQYDSIFQIDHNTGCHALDYGGIYTKHFVEYLYGQNAEGINSTHENRI